MSTLPRQYYRVRGLSHPVSFFMSLKSQPTQNRVRLQSYSYLIPLQDCIIRSVETRYSIHIPRALTRGSEDEACDLAERLAHLPALGERGEEVDGDAVAGDRHLGDDHVHQEVVERRADLRGRETF